MSELLIPAPVLATPLTDAQWQVIRNYAHCYEFANAGVMAMDDSEGSFGIVIVQAGSLNVLNFDQEHGYQAGQILIADAETGTFRVTDDTCLLRFSGRALNQLEQRQPALAAAFYAYVNQHQRESVLIRRLEAHFGELSEAHKKLILAGCHWRTLAKGTVLARAGDPCENWYVVSHGTLSGFYQADNNDLSCQLDHAQMDCQWQTGEFVGHRSLLSTGQHRATIVAATEVILVAFDRDVFDCLWQQNEGVKIMVSFDLAMSQNQSRPQLPAQRQRKIALLGLPGASATEMPLGEISEVLARSLSSGSVDRVDYSALVQLLGLPEAVGDNPAHPAWHCIYRWFAQYNTGQAGRHLMLVAEEGFSVWQQFCQANSDLVIGLANGADKPDKLGSSDGFAACFGRERWLLLYHHAATKMPQGTSFWLDQFDHPRHLHLRQGHLDDAARVMRTLTGQGVGVVFGGGHARCFAQLGTVSAMEKLGIPVDMIGGTSFGALLAAHIALEQDHEQISETNAVLRKLKPFRALRWPGLALLSGKKFDWLANNTFKDYQIEDFWLPYFCISTNLTTGEEVVHDCGEMRHAARATGSVPILIAPAKQGTEMLVDGGLVNNLPVDVMRKKTAGPIIAIDVTQSHPMQYRQSRPKQHDKAFKGLKQWFKGNKEEPSMLSLVDRSMSLISHRKIQQMKQDGLLLLALNLPKQGMTEFEAMDALIAQGHEQSLSPLKAFRQGW